MADFVSRHIQADQGMECTVAVSKCHRDAIPVRVLESVTIVNAHDQFLCEGTLSEPVSVHAHYDPTKVQGVIERAVSSIDLVLVLVLAVEDMGIQLQLVVHIFAIMHVHNFDIIVLEMTVSIAAEINVQLTEPSTIVSIPADLLITAISCNLDNVETYR